MNKVAEALFLEVVKGEEKYQTIGNSPATMTMKKTATVGLDESKYRGNKDTVIEYKKNAYGDVVVNIKSRNSETTLAVEGSADIFTKQDNSTVKVLNYILAQSNAQNDPLRITIWIDELVELGIFKNRVTANKGLDRAMRKLKRLMISGKIKENNITKSNAIMTLFPSYHRVRGKGYATVTRNMDISMDFLTPFITIFPKWAYALPSRSFSLIDYIMVQARQKRSYKSISDTQCFRIGFQSIAEHLGLPTPDETKNPQRDIADAILNAITDIEDRQFETEDVEIYLTPIYEEGAIEIFLEKGFLEVKFKGNALKYFTERSESREKILKKQK